MNIQNNVPLKNFSTFHIGGAARYFADVKDVDELKEVMAWSKRQSIRYFILGGGSNLLFQDQEYDGMIVKTDFHELTIQDLTVSVGASVSLAECIDVTLKEGLIGMEFAAGIPGTIGGAIRGNAGTYGVGMADVVLQVTFLDEHSFDEKKISNDECSFAYRHSMFKDHNHIITSAQLELHRGNVSASKEIIDERIELRHSSHPTEPSAGCIFKNIEFARADVEHLRSKGIDIDRFSKFRKIPSGHLIEQLGLKGKKIGGAQISPKHANYIINTGDASFEDVITLISYIKQQIRDAYGLQLEEEVQIVT